MKRKALILATLFLVINIVMAACNQNREYNFTINNVEFGAEYMEDEHLNFFRGQIHFEGELVQIASIRNGSFINEAHAFIKPWHTYHIKNRPTSIRVFTEIDVPNLWTAGTEVTSSFTYNVVSDDGVNMEMTQPFPSITKARPSDVNFCNIIYKAAQDQHKPGERQFRVQVTLENGSVWEHVYPRFYLVD